MSAELLYKLRVFDGWRYVPHAPTPRQMQFLNVQAPEALYGGAAGGGKSDCLLMDAIRYCTVPGYTAILFRRTYTDLALPGAIMDRSHQWLQGTDAVWNGTDKQWRFPSGAILQFGYLDTDKDKYRYQSAEFTFVGYDEASQFPEGNYTYLLSRLRRREGFPIAPRARCASNPGGVGHDWVFSRFVKPGAMFPFVPSTLEDNPHIDAQDYRERLQRLDSTTRAQLLEGRWIRDGQGLLYSMSDANVCSHFREREDTEYVLAVDLGSSEMKPTTAFVVAAFSWSEPNKVTIVESELHQGATPRSIAERIKAFPYRFYEIVVDQGGLGKGYIREFNEHYGIDARDVQKSNKLGYRKLLNGALESQELMIDESNTELIKELQLLQWNDKGTDADPRQPDHLSDAMLYAWRHCKAHLAEQPKPDVDLSTPEGLNQYAEELWEKERQRGLQNTSKPWWMR